jgi:hypothetical protein
VVDSRCPEYKGFVRAHLVVGGYIIIPSPESPNVSIVTYITQANLNGYIPQSIVKLAMVNQPLCIDGIRKIIEKDVNKYNIPPPSISAPVSVPSPSSSNIIQEELSKEEEEQEDIVDTKTEEKEEGEDEENSKVEIEEKATTDIEDVSVEQQQTESPNEDILKTVATLLASSKVLHTGKYILNFF